VTLIEEENGEARLPPLSPGSDIRFISKPGAEERFKEIN